MTSSTPAVVTSRPDSRPEEKGKPTAESSLFVIWNNGRHAEDRIVADLERRFEIVGLYEVLWTPDHTIQNFRRFYSDLPVRGVYHTLAKGRGPFLAAVVLDPLPHVVERDTSRGPRVVNAHFLDAKTEYRRWAGELTIHCTETPFETRRDLTMLLGENALSRDNLTVGDRPGRAERVLRDLTGARGWTSEAELFAVLNRSVTYVATGNPGARTEDGVLRCPDLNLLTDDYLTLHAVLDARPRVARPNGGPFRVRIADRWVDVRLRFVGDGFYDAAWAKSLLASRKRDAAGRYRPPQEEDFAALVYDRYAHRTNRHTHDPSQLSDLASALGITDWPSDHRSTAPGAVSRWMEGWLGERGYTSVEPLDPSVPYDASFAVPREIAAGRPQTPLERRFSWWRHRARQAVKGAYWHARDQLLVRAPWLRPSRWLGIQALASAVRRFSRRPGLFVLKRMVLFGRGLLFLGRRYRCPCCGWSIRGFVGQWGVLASNHDGYCPRCNAKARHRRLWLYMQEHMNLAEDDLRLLEVAPWWAISRRLIQAPNVRFVGLDIDRSGPHVTLVGDATRNPLATDSLDAALCIHTLEHIEDDRMAMRELHRVLKPGGWAIVSVPLNLDGPTYEDSAVTDPDDREREFGERGHVRMYGLDIGDRLKEAGFSVHLDRASQIPDAIRKRYGLRDDENLFVCRKPPAGA